jgi:hypothetical protein
VFSKQFDIPSPTELTRLLDVDFQTAAVQEPEHAAKTDEAELAQGMKIIVDLWYVSLTVAALALIGLIVYWTQKRS